MVGLAPAAARASCAGSSAPHSGPGAEAATGTSLPPENDGREDEGTEEGAEGALELSLPLARVWEAGFCAPESDGRPGMDCRIEGCALDGCAAGG
eukprot:CAMPEP_0202888432 /NCGR_PEP_ID=MMETSP1391-20130828/43188_1 /ASSEMBLY_ACC=CAM_ASM_000867 /TAXON_ID=1034604 /ORGANISM="Chlamydomonas leiostraca, Strain SAG 11-49" /LENGTH=94 /DNA_ID=CAMNT_0049571735 /DNA_START=537 /DNA_END=821 /DNA_ORIENTATION=+